MNPTLLFTFYDDASVINTIMRCILLLMLLLLVGCETTPTNPEFWMEKEINSCLPTAIIFKQSLRKYDVWSEVFKYTWKDSTGIYKGHAMVAYLYPPGKNQLWTYDHMGSYRTHAFTNNVMQIATRAVRARGMTNTLLTADFVK
jgi:hypothetical protein